MQKLLATVMTLGAMVVATVVGAAAQESTATIRTYQGVSYKLADPSLEVFYTIGDLKETTSATQTFGTTINVGMSSAGGGGQAAPSGGAVEERLLQGHSRATEITVSKDSAETRIPLERIRSVSFGRTADDVSGMPFYIGQYRYSASVTLVDGAQVQADYVNLGWAFVRGTTPGGRVDIPWQDVESIVFDR